MSGSGRQIPVNDDFVAEERISIVEDALQSPVLADVYRLELEHSFECRTRQRFLPPVKPVFILEPQKITLQQVEQQLLELDFPKTELRELIA